MKIKLIRNTVVNKQAYQVGEVVDTDQLTAIELIAMNKAIPVLEEHPVVIDEKPVDVESADLPISEVETAAAGPQKRKKGRN